MPAYSKSSFILFFYVLHFLAGSAQFVEGFDGPGSDIPKDWTYATGDGSVTMDFVKKEGYASMLVDATNDQRNIWWALIRRQIPGLDIGKLMEPEYELRVEARIKVSHAPRRVNLHFNHQRTTDFHSHLMEYDIPDTSNWHTISMTTRDFEVQIGDRINAQMALMDWGLKQYRVDVDYFKVDVVDRNTIGPDEGARLPYHPSIPDPDTFRQQVAVIQDAMINPEFPDMNFNQWQDQESRVGTNLLTVSGDQIVILRWDLSQFKGKQMKGSGLLELTVHAIQRSSDYEKDFGMVRITEVLGGDPDWEQEEVTYNSFCQGQPFDRVLNSQMIIDGGVTESDYNRKGNKVYFTISNPVLQRLIDGRTLGLAVRPLGAVVASFYAMENEEAQFSPRLRFSVKPD